MIMLSRASGNANGRSMRLDHGCTVVGVDRLIDAVLTQLVASMKIRPVRSCYCKSYRPYTSLRGEGGIRTRGTPNERTSV